MQLLIRIRGAFFLGFWNQIRLFYNNYRCSSCPENGGCAPAKPRSLPATPPSPPTMGTSQESMGQVWGGCGGSQVLWGSMELFWGEAHQKRLNPLQLSGTRTNPQPQYCPTATQMLLHRDCKLPCRPPSTALQHPIVPTCCPIDLQHCPTVPLNHPQSPHTLPALMGQQGGANETTPLPVTPKPPKSDGVWNLFGDFWHLTRQGDPNATTGSPQVTSVSRMGGSWGDPRSFWGVPGWIPAEKVLN